MSDAELTDQVLPRVNEADFKIPDRWKELLNDLRSTSTGLGHIPKKTITVGVTFHRELPLPRY